MAVLTPPGHRRYVTVPARAALLAGETDVLVAGGGPAGLGAAIGAAQTGADVVLAERYGFLGGNATVALVMPLMSFHNEMRAARSDADTTRLLPTDHGAGEPVVGGVLSTLLERLADDGGAVLPSADTGYVVPFDPEQFKLTALQLIEEAGVRLLLHSFASGVLDEAGGRCVIFETKSGPVAIRAKVVIDCTGDGDIAVAAGASAEIGRDEDDLVQPMTLMFRMIEFSQPRFAEYVREHPAQWRGVSGLWDLVAEARAAGELDLAREDMLFFATPHEHEVSINSTRVTRALGTDVFDLTRAEVESRAQMREIISFLRKRVPGFEDSYLAQSGVGIGVRETRRIIGDYQLTADDVLNGRSQDDVIAQGSYPIDIHSPSGSGTDLRRLPPGTAYDIPLRCLLPRGIDNLLVAGRCISGTHEAHASYRVMPIAMATGHAAGVTAALASRQHMTPRLIGPEIVQRELLRQGAVLGKTGAAARPGTRP